MKPEIKARWVAALRSGKYEQAYGALRRNVGFCCLGVLCDVASEDQIGKWEPSHMEVQRVQKIYQFNCHNKQSSDGLLPGPVMEWAGLSCPSPVVEASTLVGHNDEGESFSEIADLIERYL